MDIGTRSLDFACSVCSLYIIFAEYRLSTNKNEELHSEV